MAKVENDWLLLKTQKSGKWLCIDHEKRQDA
jgi:hypothetical protein